jgi:glycosyltransferase involved in cell wall biosynthesis
MKITIVLGAFLPVPPVMGGAVEKVWFTLAQEFARRGEEVVQISRRTTQSPREETIAGVRHVRVGGFDTPSSLLWLKFFDLIYSIRAMSILPKADIIVTNTFWLPILLRDSSRGRIYVHVARHPKGQMRFYRRAARLQVPSQSVGRAALAEVPKLADRITVIPYPAPGSTTEGEPVPMAQRDKIILFVGRIHPEKGAHLLVDAFANGPVFADWTLMIVGPTEERFGGGGQSYLVDLKRRAESASGRVIFQGAIFDAITLEQTLCAARLFVYPSLAERGESFGLAPLEAMSHGCAVLVSNLDCFHDFIQESETGFIFDHRSNSPSETLRDKIDNIIADETLLARVAETGYRKAREYSLDRVAAEFLDDFSSLIRDTNDTGTNR